MGMRRGSKTTAGALALLLTVSALPGCDSIEKETGLSKDTQIGGVSGAAVGGVIAGLAGASPAWIAGSIILGGITGGVIGNYLGKEDAEKHAKTNLEALDKLGPGKTASWKDDSSGNYGSTTVNSETKNADGSTCKTFTETVHAGGKTTTQSGKACKAPGGSWNVERS